MIKNILILALLYVCFMLFYKQSSNVDIILKDISSKKEVVENGVGYIKDKFSDDSNITNMTENLLNLEIKEFSTIEEESNEKEPSNN